MENIYRQLLNRYLLDYDERFKKIVKSGDKNIATNKYVLIKTPLIDDSVEDVSDKIMHLPNSNHFNYSFSVNDLKSCFDSYDKKQVYDEIYEECDACDGFGSVEFEFYHKGTHTLDGECPICRGEGESLIKREIVDGEFEYDNNKKIKISYSYFNINYISDIVTISEKLNVKTVKCFIDNNGTKPALFLIGDVEFVICSLPYSGYKNDDDVNDISHILKNIL